MFCKSNAICVAMEALLFFLIGTLIGILIGILIGTLFGIGGLSGSIAPPYVVRVSLHNMILNYYMAVLPYKALK